jgi:hypothetical protein
MSTDVLHYHSDGANRQAQAVLAMFQYFLCDGIESSWNDEFKHYDARIDVARWENCREQGYVLSLRPRYSFGGKQLNIAFFEHRNSDDICAIKWHELTMNSPTIDTANFGDECYSDKWDVNKSVGYGKAAEMAEWIFDQFEAAWEEMSADKE